MPVRERELKEAIKMGMKSLILQEVRLLRLEHTFTPPLVMNEVFHSIQDTKKGIVKLTKTMAQKERAILLKRMIRQAMDEEIDRAIALRQTRCVRCLHGRFYDEAGAAHVGLPIKTRAETVGCDKLQPSLRKSCMRFAEISTAASLDQYLNEMTLLYEFRDLIDRIDEIWKDYLIK